MIIFLMCFVLLNLYSNNINIDNTEDFAKLYLENIKNKTMRAISIVESNDGENTNHLILPNNQFAIGKYGLMPQTIKYIIKSDEKYANYRFLLNYNNYKLNDYLKKYPQVSKQIAYTYYDFIVKELGTIEPAYIGYAWLNGPNKAKRKLKINLSSHWHVRKIISAFNS